MTEEEIISKINAHGIRPTAIRTLVWRAIERTDFAFALADLEMMLDTVDKSSIFRALTVFVENGMLHTITDGSGQTKYCICHDHNSQTVGCDHIHITCLVCGRTFCVRNQHIPPVDVPKDFEVRHVSYVIQGVCPHCGHKDDKECCCHNS